MPVNLSIKNAPDDIVARLRERAARHRRSLRGELLTILEEAVHLEDVVHTPRGLTSMQALAEVDALRAILEGAARPQGATAEEVLAEVERLGLPTPATAMVRDDRDAD